jgi:predicted glutamine amidotransferase
MCRIWGISYNENEEDLSTAQIAAILFPALVRQGPHAYGWAQWVPNKDTDPTKPDVTWAKFPGRCDTNSALENILKNVSDDAYWVIGHTRWATNGDPADVRNNHPIPHGDIVGVHNGVLTNFEEILDVTGREDPKTEVDSEAIFAAVNKWGHIKGLRKIKGAMVAVYSRITEPDTIYIARSTGRQLTLGWTDRGNLIWASDKEALLQLEPDIVFTKFSTVSEDRVLAVSYGDIVERKTFRPRPRPKVLTAAEIAVRFGTDPSYRGTGSATSPTRPVAVSTGFEYGMGRDAAIRAYLERRQDERAQKRLFPDGQPQKRKADQ